MKKIPLLSYEIFFLLSAFGLLCAGCNSENKNLPIETKSIESTPIPTDIAEYQHFTSPKYPEIDIEFDYPSTWEIWRRNNSQWSLIGLGPEGSYPPLTLAPGDADPFPSDFGHIYIWIMPNYDMEEEINNLTEVYDRNSSIEFLGSYQSTINQIDALVYEYSVDNLEEYTSTMFERWIFFEFKDRVYKITFAVNKNERDGKFEQEYNRFIQSIELLQ